MDRAAGGAELIVRDVADPAVGWRYWQLSRQGWLRAVTQRRFEWPPGRPLRAVCTGGPGHESPSPGCNCGIHGSLDLETLREHGLCLPPEPLVLGEVALWGRIIVEERAYRAAVAYPRRLALVAETFDPGALEAARARFARYGVPVGVTDLEHALGPVSATLLRFQAMSATTRPVVDR